MDLAEFLLARIAEDEAVALEVIRVAGNRQPHIPLNSARELEFNNNGWVSASPGRILTECDAKRRIVEGIRDATSGPVTEYYIGPVMTTDDVLELLASPYAGHPDYREEWRS